MTRLPLTIAATHPAFAGHFPSRPVVPGVVLLDESLRAIASHFGIDRDKLSSTLCRIGVAKFLSPVGPGEPVWLEVQSTTKTPIEPGVISISYALRVFAGDGEAERLAVTGTVSFESLPGHAGRQHV